LLSSFRMPRLELPALTRVAKGKPCMFNVPGHCNGKWETTVWCHSNQGRHGKGSGLKSHDCYGAFGCSGCHDWYDNRVPNIAHEEKVRVFEIARDRTTYYLWANDLLKVNK
jgi:hypothetical protein